MLKKLFISLCMALFISTGAIAVGKINVNTANSEQLQMINGVGVSTAAAIIKFRESNGSFKTIDELVNVKGIGPKTLEKLSGQVSVSDK